MRIVAVPRRSHVAVRGAQREARRRASAQRNFTRAAGPVRVRVVRLCACFLQKRYRQPAMRGARYERRRMHIMRLRVIYMIRRKAPCEARWAFMCRESASLEIPEAKDAEQAHFRLAFHRGLEAAQIDYYASEAWPRFITAEAEALMSFYQKYMSDAVPRQDASSAHARYLFPEMPRRHKLRGDFSLIAMAEVIRVYE